jgi:hypothetical protein
MLILNEISCYGFLGENFWRCMALIQTDIYVTTHDGITDFDVVYGIGIHKVSPELRSIHTRVEAIYKKAYLSQLIRNLEYKMPAVLITVKEQNLDLSLYELPVLRRQ